jgi:hypothetical protein
MPTAATPAYPSSAPRDESRPDRLRLVPLGMSLASSLAVFYALCIALGRRLYT